MFKFYGVEEYDANGFLIGEERTNKIVSDVLKQLEGLSVDDAKEILKCCDAKIAQIAIVHS